MKNITAIILAAAMAAPATATTTKQDNQFRATEAVYQCGVKYEGTEFERVFEAIYNLSTNTKTVTPESLKRWEKDNELVAKGVAVTVFTENSLCLKMAASFFSGAAKEAEK